MNYYIRLKKESTVYLSVLITANDVEEAEVRGQQYAFNMPTDIDLFDSSHNCLSLGEGSEWEIDEIEEEEN
jgi:hypothetical protein